MVAPPLPSPAPLGIVRETPLPAVRESSALALTQAYGLDWQVGLAPVFAQGPSLDGPRLVPQAQAVVRQDTGAPLGIVGRRYRPIQNAEAFRIFDPLVARERAVYDRAGSCDGGRRVWIQAKLPGSLWITKDDEVERYLLLSMLHGGGSLQLLETPIRVWCKNTLLRALEEGRARTLRIRHAGDIAGQVREAERLLEASLGSFQVFADQARAFAGRMIRKEALDQYFRTLVPDPKEGEASRAIATRETFVRLFEMGKGNALPSVRGTLWAALNGVIEWIDHERPTRRSRGTDPRGHRWASAQFGSGRLKKEQAWREALSLLG